MKTYRRTLKPLLKSLTQQAERLSVSEGLRELGQQIEEDVMSDTSLERQCGKEMERYRRWVDGKKNKRKEVESGEWAGIKRR